MNWFRRVILRKDMEQRIAKLEAKVFTRPDTIGFVVDCSDSMESAAAWDDSNCVSNWVYIQDKKV